MPNYTVKNNKPNPKPNTNSGDFFATNFPMLNSLFNPVQIVTKVENDGKAHVYLTQQTSAFSGVGDAVNTFNNIGKSISDKTFWLNVGASVVGSVLVIISLQALVKTDVIRNVKGSVGL